MSLLNKTLVKPLKLGVNSVTLTSFGEKEAEKRTLDNGDTLEFKAYLFLNLQSTTDPNSQDQHRLYFEDNNEQDQNILNTIVNAIVEQTGAEGNNLGELLNDIMANKKSFKVHISEKPNNDATKIFRNYQYSSKMIALAELA